MAISFSEFQQDLQSFIHRMEEPYPGDSGVSGDGFNRLARDLFRLQHGGVTAYRRLCEARGVAPESVLHWGEIPAVPSSAFKELVLSSLPAQDQTAVFHSSGTTQTQPSRHFHSVESLRIYEASLIPWFRRHLAPPASKLTLLLLTPPPSGAPHSSLVHMFETIKRRLGNDRSRFVGRVDAENNWDLDLEMLIAWLREAEATEEPVYILGTAFSWVHLTDYCTTHDLSFELPPGSVAMETGGYKGKSRVLSRSELHAAITQGLGIPAANIVCEYGMSELSSQAYDTVAGSTSASAPRGFRFPPWARAVIVSPETGREVQEGETGLIRVFDLANVRSVLAIQTEDLGHRSADAFVLEGRATQAEARGCSLMSA